MRTLATMVVGVVLIAGSVLLSTQPAEAGSCSWVSGRFVCTPFPGPLPTFKA